ncbi:MAG TPA: SDR family oxidoreductase [Candidatus Limnocylindrales bacterium]|nr:SDR family oxidoreductase [Candidatus Limnocylindrales bacterium]
MTGSGDPRPAALLTGVGRLNTIAAGIAARLADDGWDLALSYWRPYDAALQAGSADDEPSRIADDLRARGATAVLLPGDLSDPGVPDRLVADAVAALGPLRGLVLSHAQSHDSGIMDTTVEAFDRHMAVNARASWQLIAAFARQAVGGGAIVALTSDHSAFNMPYGASKGALDRIVRAAAVELGDRGIRVNAVNPGPVDTGWIDDDLRETLSRRQPTGRLGTPADVARMVAFLLSDDGAWTSGQVIHTDGGFSA